MKKLGWESIYYGLFCVNSLYLAVWVVFAFGVFRYMPGMFGYLASSVCASLISLGICDTRYDSIL